MKDAAFVQGDGLRVVSGVKYVSDRHQKNYWLLAVTLVEAHQQVGKEKKGEKTAFVLPKIEKSTASQYIYLRADAVDDVHDYSSCSSSSCSILSSSS